MWGVYELDVVAEDSVGRFVARWYGLPDRPPAEVDGTGVDGAGVPAALVNWHRVAARYSLPLSRDHIMVDISEISEISAMSAPVEFWVGAGERYAYVPGPPDPQVVENGTVPTGLSLSRFLLYATVYEATYSPLHGLVLMAPPPGAVRAVSVRLRELDDPLWRWPDPATRYLGDDDLLGHVGPDRVVIAARHRDALGRFDGLGLPWDWDTRTLR